MAIFFKRETFFDVEAENSERIRGLIMTSPQRLIRDTIYVPRIHPSHSTPRVLTMEWIDGACRLTDQDKIKEMGLSIKGVMQGVCEVFAAQIFTMGFVQCDGHPSNVLVRKHPNGRKSQHQIVLIG
jgi:aarF domain-containing kinase